jgi:hypothetical protein
MVGNQRNNIMMQENAEKKVKVFEEYTSMSVWRRELMNIGLISKRSIRQ